MEWCGDGGGDDGLADDVHCGGSGVGVRSVETEGETMRNDDVVLLTARQWVNMQEALAAPAEALPALRELLSRVEPWVD